MIVVVCVALIFFIIPAVISMYSLHKAGKICDQVKFEQPDFFDIKTRYKLMTQINKTQFMFYIVSGKYKKLNNPKLRKTCQEVRWMYICSTGFLAIVVGSIVLHSMLTAS